MKTSEKGVSLLIVFLIMTIMLVVILNASVMLFRRVAMLGDLGNSESAFNAAVSGIEKTLYFDRRVVPAGSNRGFCNTCSACSSSDCQNCQLIPLGVNSCDNQNCANCRLRYTTSFNGRSFAIDATLIPTGQVLEQELYINAKGFYRSATHTLEFRETK